MSPLKLDYDPSTREGTFFIDNSGMERFDTCQRSAENYLCKRRESNKDRPALTFGKIIHKLLEHRYKHLDKDTLSLLPELIEMAAVEFGKWTPPDGDFRNYSMAVDVLQEYALRYPFESFELATINGLPAVEIPFACPLATIDVSGDFPIWNSTMTGFNFVPVTRIHLVIKGKMDLVTRREGRLYPFDHKTTSMMGPSYFNDFQISSQVYTYSWACEQLTGEAPYGFIINALGVRAPTKTGKKLEFSRHTVIIYKELITEWKLDTIHKCADFFEMVRRGYFPKQTKWCAGKFGMCEYHGVCSLAPDMREIALSTNEFKNVTWDPLKAED